MQITKHLANGLYFWFIAFFFVSCVSGKRQSHVDRETFARAVLASVQPGSNFSYDVVGVMAIGDSLSQQARWFCYLFGGPPTSTVGPVGVFDLTGRLLDATSLEGLYAFETNVSVFAQGDSVILRVLDASGTGMHSESLVVLTLKGGKLFETFRCNGLSYSMHGEFYDQTVQLSFCDICGDGAPELIRLVTVSRYASRADQEEGKPCETKRTAEVFQFDTRAHRYVRVFE